MLNPDDPFVRRFSVLVRAGLLCVRSIVPGLGVYCIVAAYYCYTGARQPGGFFWNGCRLLFEIWAVVEIVFLCVYMVRSRSVQALAQPTPHPDYWRTFCRTLKSTPDVESLICGWFKHTPLEDIKRGNLVQFLAWVLFAVDSSDVSAAQTTEVNQAISLIEEMLQDQGSPITFQQGFNRGAECIRLSLDPVVTIHRPAFIYGAIVSFRYFLQSMMKSQYQFSRGEVGGVGYWIRTPPPLPLGWEEMFTAEGSAYYVDSRTQSSTWTRPVPELPPLVLFHGVGIGAAGYVGVLSHIVRQFPHRVIIIPEMPSIALSGQVEVTPAEQFVEAIERILSNFGLSQATLFGHSYGSIPVSWMIRRRPKLVHSVVFVDPVVFLLCNPFTAYNFVYKTPRLPQEFLFEFFVRTEIGVATTLMRHFWWYDNICWAEDVMELGVPTSVFLSELDSLVPTKDVVDYLEDTHATLGVFRGLNHGQFMVHREALRDVVLALDSNARHAQASALPEEEEEEEEDGGYVPGHPYAARAAVVPPQVRAGGGGGGGVSVVSAQDSGSVVGSRGDQYAGTQELRRAPRTVVSVDYTHASPPAEAVGHSPRELKRL